MTDRARCRTGVSAIAIFRCEVSGTGRKSSNQERGREQEQES